MLIPTETVQDNQGGRKVSSKTFYPGYIFVQMVMSDEAWHVVRDTPKVTGFVGGRKPQPVPSPEIQSVVQQVAAGEMKAYGITAKTPSPQFPNAASFVQELGPKLEILYWHALFAPAGTPEAIIDKLNSALQEIVADPAILKSRA